MVFVIASRKPDNALYLLFPSFGAIPGVLDVLLVFAPLEAVLVARGLSAGAVVERDARWAFACRAEHLGPAAATGDRAYAERMGWTGWLYDANGGITPEPSRDEVVEEMLREERAEPDGVTRH